MRKETKENIMVWGGLALVTAIGVGFTYGIMSGKLLKDGPDIPPHKKQSHPPVRGMVKEVRYVRRLRRAIRKSRRSDDSILYLV
jgi:hypothetical protein